MVSSRIVTSRPGECRASGSGACAASWLASRSAERERSMAKNNGRGDSWHNSGERRAELTAGLRALAQPLGTARDLDPLLDLIGDSRYVLLGEASHGTSEFYTWRAEIS